LIIPEARVVIDSRSLITRRLLRCKKQLAFGRLGRFLFFAASLA
jgi:hypothetical protein